MATLEQKIADASAEIDRLIKRIDEYRKSATAWRNDVKVCNQILKKKRTACENANKERLDKAKDREAVVRESEKELEELRSLRNQLLELLEDRQKADNEAQINLSNQGLTFQAVQTQAQGQADAAVRAAEVAGDAAMKTATESAKSQKYVFIAIAVVIVVAGGIFAWTKFKK